MCTREAVYYREPRSAAPNFSPRAMISCSESSSWRGRICFREGVLFGERIATIDRSIVADSLRGSLSSKTLCNKLYCALLCQRYDICNCSRLFRVRLTRPCMPLFAISQTSIISTVRRNISLLSLLNHAFSENSG